MADMSDDKKKALAAALGQIEKQFGKGSVMKMGDGSAIRDIDAVSTGSLGLDVALGHRDVREGMTVHAGLAKHPCQFAGQPGIGQHLGRHGHGAGSPPAGPRQEGHCHHR